MVAAGLCVAGLRSMLVAGAYLLFALGGLCIVVLFKRRQSWRRRCSMSVAAIVLCTLGVVAYYVAGRVLDLRTYNVCANDIVAIYSALNQFDARTGAFPARLTALVEAELIDERCLCSPFKRHEPCDGPDYLYVLGLTSGDRDTWPVVFDKADTHDDGARMVLYLSGRTAVLTNEAFTEQYSSFSEEYEAKYGIAPRVLEE